MPHGAINTAVLLTSSLTMALAALVLLLMMVLGLAMRLAQSNWVDLAPDLFYQVMTAHGVGMVGAAGLAGARGTSLRR